MAPFTWTRPSATARSASRRDNTPDRASARCTRIGSSGAAGLTDLRGRRSRTAGSLRAGLSRMGVSRAGRASSRAGRASRAGRTAGRASSRAGRAPRAGRASLRAGRASPRDGRAAPRAPPASRAPRPAAAPRDERFPGPFPVGLGVTRPRPHHQRRAVQSRVHQRVAVLPDGATRTVRGRVASFRTTAGDPFLPHVRRCRSIRARAAT